MPSEFKAVTSWQAMKDQLIGEFEKQYRKIAPSYKPSLHRQLRGAVRCQPKTKRMRLMYLKKVDGPRAVTLPDGSVMTRADLPDAETRRWVASRKAAVVRAVKFGLIKRSEALKLYSLSEEEFDSWQSAVELYGNSALKATLVQQYRQL